MTSKGGKPLRQIDFNCDLGESFGHYRMGNDAEVLPLISSANIACGFHAGDSSEMRRTVARAAANGVAIGVHPGLADLEGFGRREMALTPQEAYDCVVYQIGALKGVAASQNVSVHHVKPHGALYHMASYHEDYARAVAKAIADVDDHLLLFAMGGTHLASAGERVGLHVIHEVFADRTYQPDGSLTPRAEGNALITDPEVALQQVLRMINEGSVQAVDGSTLPIQAETVCIHGDGQRALEFARIIRERLQQTGITIQAW